MVRGKRRGDEVCGCGGGECKVEGCAVKEGRGAQGKGGGSATVEEGSVNRWRIDERWLCY